MLRSIRSAKPARKLLVAAALAGSLVPLSATASAQAAMRQCPGTAHTAVSANSATSCAFAHNIASSFQSAVARGKVEAFTDDAARGPAYSPTTNRTYIVRCANHGTSPGGMALWSCSAGRGARVRIVYFD